MQGAKQNKKSDERSERREERGEKIPFRGRSAWVTVTRANCCEMMPAVLQDPG